MQQIRTLKRGVRSSSCWTSKVHWP